MLHVGLGSASRLFIALLPVRLPHITIALVHDIAVLVVHVGEARRFASWALLGPHCVNHARVAPERGTLVASTTTRCCGGRTSSLRYVRLLATLFRDW